MSVLKKVYRYQISDIIFGHFLLKTSPLLANYAKLKKKYDICWISEAVIIEFIVYHTLHCYKVWGGDGMSDSFSLYFSILHLICFCSLDLLSLYFWYCRIHFLQALFIICRIFCKIFEVFFFCRRNIWWICVWCLFAAWSFPFLSPSVISTL